MHDRPVLDWREELENVVRMGRATAGDATVRQALETVLAGLVADPDPASPLTPPIAVLGVDGCRGGWVGVLMKPDGRTTLHVGKTIVGIVEHIREQDELGVVAIDIPIGLPDDSIREADRLARAELAGKASCVFATAPREAYLAADYEAARAASIAASQTGASLSAQSWALGPKILEVDAWVRSRPSVVVIEVHPELSFARIQGEPVLAKKKTSEGASTRRRLLASAGITVPAMYPGMGYEEDDLLDACAAVWTAARHASGRSESFPAEPEVFSDGIGAAIRV